MVASAPDLQQAWTEACAEFKRATGIDIAANSDTHESAEDVVNRLNNCKAKDAEAHARLNKAKKAVHNTFIAIQRVGQVAAQGASMVFGGPATLTMNCVSFLIDAGIAYKNIAHNIDDLFSRISTVMERFQIYRDHEQILNPAMIRVAHRLLMAVVSICGLCIKVLHKNSILKFLSVGLFSSDGGIKAQFDVLASLEAEELQMKGTLTLIATETSKRDITTGFEQVNATGSEILKSVSQLSASSSDQSILTELRERLDFDDAASKAEYRAYQNELVSGTCSWIKDDTEYQSWSDTDRSDTSLLILKGDEGSGKSYALTAMILDLMRRYPQGLNNASRTSIGYYYLAKVNRREGPSSKGGASSSRAGPSIRDALRTWSWQAVNNDLFYRKDLASMFKKDSDLGDLKDSWQKLFLTHSDKGANFLLLLDGIHELEEQELNNLIGLLNTLVNTKSSAGRLKIMLTSRIPFVQKISANIPDDFGILDLKEKTHSDMEVYIQEKASALPIFQRDTPKIQQLKERVCSGLLEAINGSFILADVKLREIAGKYDPEEVMQVVEKAKDGANLSDSILEDIRECNRTLNAREMQNLNTLLLWVMYGEGDFLILELEALLNIQHGGTSLQPLSGDIKDKFSAFLRIVGEDDDPYATVVLRYDSIADYFRNASKEQHAPETSSSQALSKGEIQMAQHFIQKLCEGEVYNKLGLQAFFDHKLSQSDASVAVDCENAHATISLSSLRVLTGEFAEEGTGMTWYSGYYLTHHLKEIDLDNIDPRLKAELGPRLVKLFTDLDTMKKAIKDKSPLWSYNDVGLREVLRLLRSSAVMKKITGVDEAKQAWVEAVMSDASPEMALLRDVAKANAELWLSFENSQEVMVSFAWLYGYLNKIESKEHSDVERIEDEPALTTISTEGIESIFQLAKTLHVFDESKPVLQRNLAVTYRQCGHIHTAIEYFKRAIAIDADYMNAHAGLALAYSSQSPEPDWEKALLHCDIVIDHLKQGKPVFEGNKPEEEMKGYLYWKATWLRKLFRYDDACAIYNGLLEKNPADDNARLELIYTLCEAQSYSIVVEMLQELQKQIDLETKITNLSRFFRTHGNDHTYHHTIVRAFKQVDNIAEIKSHYRQAIDDFKIDKNKQDRGTIQIRWSISYHFAAILYTQAANAAEKEEAVEVWERIIAKSNGSNDEPVLLSARRLAKSYIAKALEAGKGSVVAENMLGKVKAFVSTPSGENSGDDDMSMGLSRAEVRTLVGRYHSKVGELDKAREELRPAIDVGVKLLSDEDPENDYQGYVKLGNALMDFGDDANAIASWSMIQPTEGLPTSSNSGISPASTPSNGASKEEPQVNATNGSVVETSLGAHVDEEDGRSVDTNDTTSSQPPLLRRATSRIASSMEGPINYFCDGGCGKTWTYADDIYACRECIDVQFCESCRAKLRQGKIRRDVCDSTHEFMHVPQWEPESLKRVQEGKVLVGDQVLEVSAWLDGIKREWGL